MTLSWFLSFISQPCYPTKGGSMDAEGVPCICFVGRLSIADDFSTDDGIA